METLKIVKIGGNIINNPTALESFIQQFSSIKTPKILVHGGGTLATEMAQQLDVKVEMIEGRRKTNTDTLDIITMVYAGKINKNIIAKLQENHCNALGFTGADGNTIVAIKRPVTHIDYGFAGDVVQVNTEVLQTLLHHHITPVFCALTHDKNGQLLNTNADTIASELAIAFAKLYQTELYYCFEKSGVLQDVNDEHSVIENINAKNYQALIENNIITDGMLPKLNNCFHAINKQVRKVCIGKPEMLFNSNVKHTTIQAVKN
ncbi:acetylglutamate kinase [Tenacibaculum holothuriorum]|uniref:Acetylglutamate kinase n=1 Tax=Tenacibaculum holothuriorum TaxID=1635173 RepID=A0A1Y2PC68_9FLAO|nr:acetylglutamate kinase [Tenacibaculum holothuriorum]OSY88076.1 acetylglutamate kinase [Tenacibaculum holothuriorum]